MRNIQIPALVVLQGVARLNEAHTRSQEMSLHNSVQSYRRANQLVTFYAKQVDSIKIMSRFHETVGDLHFALTINSIYFICL